MKNEKPFVSVVIVSFNGLGILKITLPSIINLSYPSHRREILVVDNSSNDGTAQYLAKEYPEVKIIRNKENLGYVGVNSAIPYCRGEYIYFINNDIKAKKDCLKILVDLIKDDKSIAMVSPALVNYYDHKLASGGTWASRAMYTGHLQKDGEKRKAMEIPYMGVGLIRKSFVERFGCIFDPDYFIYAEDFDLGLRIRLAGMKTVLAFSALNYHMHAITMKRHSTAERNTFLLERNSLMTFLKIFSVKMILVLLPYVLAMRLLSILKDLSALSIKNAFARITAIGWVIVNSSKILKKRNAIQKLRNADDKYILKIFTERYLFRKPFIV